jgi:hypothetical protein
MNIRQQLQQAAPTAQQQSCDRQIRAVRNALREHGCEMYDRGHYSWFVTGTVATGLVFRPNKNYWQSASLPIQRIAQKAAKEAQRCH